MLSIFTEKGQNRRNLCTFTWPETKYSQSPLISFIQSQSILRSVLQSDIHQIWPRQPLISLLPHGRREYSLLKPRESAKMLISRSLAGVSRGFVLNLSLHLGSTEKPSRGFMRVQRYRTLCAAPSCKYTRAQHALTARCRGKDPFWLSVGHKMRHCGSTLYHILSQTAIIT